MLNTMVPAEKNNKNDALILDILYASIFVTLYFIFIFYIWHCIIVVKYPYPLDYGEGVVLNFAAQFIKYGTYYFDIHAYPFTHGAYPPVFVLIIAPLIKLLGAQIAIARVLSFFAALLISAVLYLIFMNESGNRKLSIVFTFIPFACYYIYYWSPLARVDMLAILFSVTGLYIYVKYSKTKSYLQYACHLFFILAFYTKHSAIAAPMSVLAFTLAVERDFRGFLKNAACYAVPLGIIFLLINIMTRGQFYLHMVTYTGFFKFDWPAASGLIGGFFKNTAFLIVLCVMAFFYKRRLSVFTLYALVTLVSIITVAKPGAHVNYFIEPFIALLILTFLSVDYLLKKTEGKIMLTVSLLIVVLISILVLTNPYMASSKSIFLEKISMKDREKDMEKLDGLLRKTEGRVLSEDLGVVFTHNREAVLEPFQFSGMARHGLWNQAQLIRDCNDKRFTVIISGHRLSSIEGIPECIKNNYVLHDAIHGVDGTWNIYLLKSTNRLHLRQ